jgi:hypothetical protein
MDLAKPLRAAHTRLAQADRDLAEQRRELSTAAANYDRVRRYQTTHTDRARQAWGIALMDWAAAWITRETAKDAVALERRDTDRTAEVAVMATPKGPR